MGVPALYLPDDSPSIGYAYTMALSQVNPSFACMQAPMYMFQGCQSFGGVPGPMYMYMVYNLAGHLLASWAPDVDGQVFITVEGTPYGYFQYLRKQNNMLGFVTGIVSSSGDEGTNVSLMVPKQAENLTITQLQMTTTPWGRTYLGYAQSYGTNWGMS